MNDKEILCKKAAKLADQIVDFTYEASELMEEMVKELLLRQVFTVKNIYGEGEFDLYKNHLHDVKRRQYDASQMLPDVVALHLKNFSKHLADAEDMDVEEEEVEEIGDACKGIDCDNYITIS